MLTIMLVDDDKKMLQTLTEYIHFYETEKGETYFVKQFQNGLELLKEKNMADILLLDIDMPGINGLELAHAIRKRDSDCIIIFITNMAQYALNGYEVHALDFFVKPVSYKTFSVKFGRAVSLALRNQKFILNVNVDYGKKRIHVSDIYYIEVRQHQLLYHTSQGVHEAWGTLKNAADELKECGFALCNSYLLVNLKYVTKITKNTVWVAGEPLAVSRGKQKAFLDALTNFEG